MTVDARRRQFLSSVLAGGAGLASLSRFETAEAQAAGLRLGRAEAFGWEALREMARKRAETPWQTPKIEHEELLEGLDYDLIQKIRFRPEFGLWAAEPGQMPVQFFHLHRWQKQPVRIAIVEGGQAREIQYDEDLFEILDPQLAKRIPDNLGFAGFRVLNGAANGAVARPQGDWLSYQGASYFRSSGVLDQYGQSARGIAINTGLPQPEEFPAFTRFWLEKAAPGSRTLTIYALLEGASLTGAYRFVWHRPLNAAVTTEVSCDLFVRRDIERLGVAPLTSMYWYGENDRRMATDWRPEVHDTDGLALWTGAGERIWRPHNNPPKPVTNSFLDKDPKGFGLFQRDRQFDHYHDDGVFYEKRPSVWIEPLGAWGEGSVQLYEWPTDDEIYDNVVAYWVPAAPVQAGQQLSYQYRMHWAEEEPFVPNVGRVQATRVGKGGVPGHPRPEGQFKFVVDFEGGPLASLAQRFDVEVVVEPSRGSVVQAYGIKVVGTPLWRAFFDLKVEGGETVDMRMFMRLEGQTLTETWLYQFYPDAVRFA